MRLITITFLVALAIAAPAAAATIAVDRTDDADVSTCSAAPSDCTLRGAIENAQLVSPPATSTITVPAGRITLATPLPDMAGGTFTIAGAGARLTFIDGGGRVGPIFAAPTAAVTIQDLTVTGGASTGFEQAAVTGDETLERVAVVDNQEIGAVLNNAVMQDTLVARNNGDQGGGVIAQGSVIRNSTITDNTAHPDPAAPPYVFAAGLFAAQFDAVEHTTIAGNHVAPGASLLSGVNLGVLASTSLGAVTESSIIANPGTAGPDCGGPVQSQGNNVSSDLSCGFGQPSDHQGVDPLLGPLADNGGPTDTMALLAGSPAIDAGARCPAADQRGQTRTQGLTCDAGAFESAFTAPPPAVVPPPPGPITVTAPAPPPPPPVTVTTPAPAPPVAPIDRTPPKLTVGAVGRTIGRSALTKGLKVTIRTNEPAVAVLTLLVAQGHSHTPEVELAERSLPAANGSRTVTLRPTRRLRGSGRLAARLRVVAYDLAGNRSSRAVDLAIEGARRRR